MKYMFSFEGKIGRFQFWCDFILVFVVFFVLVVMSILATGWKEIFMQTFTLISYIPLLWCLSASAIKRCNDLGVPGWYMFIPGWNIVMLPFVKGK